EPHEEQETRPVGRHLGVELWRVLVLLVREHELRPRELERRDDEREDLAEAVAERVDADLADVRVVLEEPAIEQIEREGGRPRRNEREAEEELRLDVLPVPARAQHAERDAGQE